MKTNGIFGLIFIGVGIALLGNVLDIWETDIFFDGWWSLFIIIPSLLGYLKKDWVTSTIWLVIGLLLLMSANDIIDWSVIIPAILIISGLYILFKPKSNINKKSLNEYSAIFSSNENKIEDKITDTNITTLFGGVDLDMKNALLEEDVIVECTCLFGGVDITVPDGVNVVVKGTPIFGGIENKTVKGKGKTITINITCIFGGVEIK